MHNRKVCGGITNSKWDTHILALWNICKIDIQFTNLRKDVVAKPTQRIPT